MAGEIAKEVATPVTEKVTDEMLRSAYTDAVGGVKEEVKEEIKKEEVKEEVKKEEELIITKPPEVTTSAEEDQKDRTRLGRKLKALEEDIHSKFSRIEELLAKRQAEPNPSPLEDDSGEFVGTKEDVIRVVTDYADRKLKKEQSEASEYQKKYGDIIVRKGFDDETDHEEIIKEMFSKPDEFNLKVTGKPEIDAELNYNKAKSSYYIKVARAKQAEIEAAKKKPNVKGQEPSGFSGGSSNDIKPNNPIQLDEYAEKFLSKLNSYGTPMSKESIERAMTGEERFHTKGKMSR